MMPVLDQEGTHQALMTVCMLVPHCPFIYDVLLRFRVHKVALIGDIEKALLNVSVHPRDRDYLRFLWIDDVTSSRPKLQVY